MSGYLANEAHIRRALKDYSGPWAGEIQQVLNAYTVLAEDHRRLKAICDRMVECEGDLKAVHIPHDLFRQFVDAVKGNA